MEMELQRTTVRLPSRLYHLAKMKAAQEDTTLQSLIVNALLALNWNSVATRSSSQKKDVGLKSYSLGKMKSGLSREKMYGSLDFL